MNSQRLRDPNPGEEYTSPAEAVADILSRLHRASRILICGHIRADGDCIGSMVAMYEFLHNKKKEVSLFFLAPMQDMFNSFMPEDEGPSVDFPSDFDADLTVCVDAASADRIIEDFGVLVKEPVINIDHHGDNTRFGQTNWIGPEYASVGEMICELIEAEPGSFTPFIARALYLAVATDTGGFRFGNTSERSFRTAALLTRHGAQPAEVAQIVWGNKKPESIQIASAVLNSMQLELDGRLVWAALTQEMVARYGGEANEPDNLSGELRAVRGVEVAVLLRESVDGKTRASIRSSGRVNVSIIAGTLGGGGHPAASGVTLDCPFDEGKLRILEAVRTGVRMQLDA